MKNVICAPSTDRAWDVSSSLTMNNVSMYMRDNRVNNAVSITHTYRPEHGCAKNILFPHQSRRYRIVKPVSFSYHLVGAYNGYWIPLSNHTWYQPLSRKTRHTQHKLEIRSRDETCCNVIALAYSIVIRHNYTGKTYLWVWKLRNKNFSLEPHISSPI